MSRVPPATTRCAPAHDVVAGGPVAVGAVDVEQVDGAVDVAEGVLGLLAHVADALAHPGGLEVGVEHLVVALAELLGGDDLLGAPIGADVGVDGDHLGARGRGAGQHDRRPAPEAADLDDARPLAQLGGPVPQAPGLVGRHPALDVGHGGERLVEAGGSGSGHDHPPGRGRRSGTGDPASGWSQRRTGIIEDGRTGERGPATARPGRALVDVHPRTCRDRVRSPVRRLKSNHPGSVARRSLAP